MAEHLAELVIADLADVVRTPAEGGHADDRCWRPSRPDISHPGPHRVVELAGARPRRSGASSPSPARPATNPSDAWLSTSTSALPMPSTSMLARVSHGGPCLRREIPIEEQGEPLAGAGREAAGSVMTALASASGTRRRTTCPPRDARAEHDLGGGHVLHEIGHHRLHGHRRRAPRATRRSRWPARASRSTARPRGRAWPPACWSCR